MNEPHARLEHRWWEDAFAFLLGTAMVALGLQMLTHLGLLTGQTAGLAVLVSYATGWPFGAVFFVVNLPFYILAFTRLGWRFTIKTAIAVTLVSVFSETLPLALSFAHLDPTVGAALAGATIGLGLLAVFRHGASLGGIGILALFLQERARIQAGWVQLDFDGALFAAALFLLDPWLVAWSLLGAVVTNLIVGVNHRRDRYIGR